MKELTSGRDSVFINPAHVTVICPASMVTGESQKTAIRIGEDLVVLVDESPRKANDILFPNPEAAEAPSK